jgi:hypothetical protein
MEAATTALEPGTLVGEYIAGERLRAEGDVVVHRARQTSVDRVVELHVLAAGPGSAAFLARARAVAGVDHPHLLAVYDAGVDGGRAFAVTRLAAGRPLEQVLAEGPLEPAAAVSVIEQLAGALEALERAGVPVDPSTGSVLLEGEPGAPVALLSSLPAPDSATPPAAALAALLDTLIGPGAERATTAAREAAATGSPSAVAAAARAALPRRRRRSRAVLAASVALLAAAAIAVVALLAGDDAPPPAPAVPARLAATIPIGAEPLDMVVAGGAMWVSTTNGRIVRVDTRSNRVVGTSLQIGRGEGLALVADESALYAFDGDGNTVARLDPRSGRVLARRHIAHGTPLTGAVVDGTLWVGSEPFDDDPESVSEVIPLDALTLRRKGEGVPVGRLPAAIRADGSALLVVGEMDGTLTRVDTRTGAARRLLIGPKPERPALLGDRLWVPDGATGVLAAIDKELAQPPDTVVPVGQSPAVAVARGVPWALVADQTSGAGAPARLVRLDARGRVVGRPLDLGRGGENLVAADGDLWVSSIRRRALLRVTPSARTPPAAPAREGDPTGLRSGPSRPGRRRATLSGVGLSIDPGGAGWLVTTAPETVDLRRYDDPGIGVAIMVPEVVYGAHGSVQRARSAAQIARVLRRADGLRMRPAEPVVGAAGARTFLLTPSASAPPADFCGGPCVPLVGRDRVTQLVQAPARGRLTLLDVGGRPVFILEDTPDGRSLAQTRELVASLDLG